MHYRKITKLQNHIKLIKKRFKRTRTLWVLKVDICDANFPNKYNINKEYRDGSFKKWLYPSKNLSYTYSEYIHRDK